MFNALFEKINDLVAQGLPLVLYVGGDSEDLPFSYTVGMAAFNLPDIILPVPIDFETARYVLTAVAKRWIQDPLTVSAGDLTEIIDQMSVRVRFVDCHSEFTRRAHVATQYNAALYFVAPLPAQILLPDEFGSFPGEAHYKWVPQPFV